MNEFPEEEVAAFLQSIRCPRCLGNGYVGHMAIGHEQCLDCKGTGHREGCNPMLAAYEAVHAARNLRSEIRLLHGRTQPYDTGNDIRDLEFRTIHGPKTISDTGLGLRAVKSWRPPTVDEWEGILEMVETLGRTLRRGKE